MATDVVMPQMGESIAEGTIVRWIKKVGEKVDRDEPLFEISTDKVDAEIPSPAAGVISEIRVKEGETVPVNSVVAVIGSASAGGSTTAMADKAAGEVKPAAVPEAAPAQRAPVAAPAAHTSTAREEKTPAASHEMSTEDALHQRSSPLVRKIAKEHNIDISQIHGTGIAGRVTKDDILGFIEGSASAAPQSLAASAGQAAMGAATSRSASAAPAGAATARQASSGGDRVEKMSPMRKRIAEHMVASRRTSAHVHSVFDVNFSRVAQIREAKKAEFERNGVKLTFLSFIVQAAVEALRAVPIVNASVDGDNVVYHKDVHVGVAVAL